MVIRVSIDKQRQINEIPQGGIVNDKNLLSLGYCCHSDSILSKGQFKCFNGLINTMSNIVPTFNTSGDIKINFECTPDMQEEIVKKIIDELIKKV
jgi:hypothetical protein